MRKIAIVGGGIAGIYTAWRLLQQNEQEIKDNKEPQFEIHLYEKEDNFGGRIRSQKISCIPFRPELGAMRFRTSHLILNALMKELGISTRPFNLSSPAFYVRGRRLTSSEITKGRCGSCHAESPFHLRPCEYSMSAVDLIRSAIKAILEALNFPNLHQGKARQIKRKIKEEDIDEVTWYYIKEEGIYQGLHLYSIGFWNLLQHFLSNEAYVMVHEVLSLESILGNWNAAEAIPWFLADFASDQYEMVPGGLSQVADGLYQKILEIKTEEKRLVNTIEIWKNRRVNKITHDGKSWTVNFKHQENGSDGESDRGLGYDDVILDLPRRALKGLKVEDKRDSFKSWPPKWVSWVKGHRMFKLFLLYSEPWWMGDNFPGCDTGRVFTDLPLRQIYYFSPTWMDDHGVPTGSTPEDGLALLMASYSDEHYVSFWEPMLNPKPKLGLNVFPDQPYLERSAKISENDWNGIIKTHEKILARRRMVEKVHALLTEIHGREIPRPILGIAQDWDAGWHTWIVGSKPWEKAIRHERVQPLNNLFLCGEAYSPEQGWIEGALKSSEQVLAKLTKEKPDWLRKLHADLNSYIDPYTWLDENKRK
ncbi:MAG TPA: FAD-dependent oxidoreductase [Blastocatellia bacterium]|nr:FAD-dependent oxidoreductase [Blastocatellia bacterium]